jgi:hypothetical protein
LHPPSLRITVVIVLMAAMGLGGSLAQSAAAAVSATVKPAANQFGADRQDFGYTINPGGQVEDGIVVVNDGTTPLHLDLAAKGSKGIGAWTHADQDDVTVSPGESVEVPFAVTVPDDAAPGDYVGAIAGVRIRLRVGGALKPSLAVENVQVHDSKTVTYTIRNTGNAILSARQSVSVSGPFGRWAVDADKLADTPPVLPGETLKVSAPLHDVTPALRLTATVTLVPLLTDAAGSIAPLAATKASGHAWAVPWPLLLSILALCGLAVAGLAFRVRSRSRVTWARR